MHLYKAEIWQSPIGWYVADTHDLVHDSASWFHPARLLNMTASEFALYLINEWKVDYIHFSDNSCYGLLSFRWKDYNLAHKYQLFINKKARERNWTI